MVYYTTIKYNTMEYSKTQILCNMKSQYYTIRNQTNIVWRKSRHTSTNQHTEAGHITYCQQIKPRNLNLINIS